MIFWLASFCILLLVPSFGIARYRSRIYREKYPAIGEFMQVDDVTMHYYDTVRAGRSESANGTPLVFIHGASSNLLDSVLAFEKQLGDEHRLIFVDRPGHGYSTRSSAAQSDPFEQADLIAKLLSALQVDQVIVVGHSWGGAVVAAMGLRYAALLKGLVFIAPATHPWPGGVLWYYRVANLPIIGHFFAWCVAAFVGKSRAHCAAVAVFAPDRMPKDYPEAVGAELALRPSQFLANAADIVGLKQHVQAMSTNYASITTPALIVTGSKDDVVWPHLHAHGLLRDLQNAKLVEYDDCGHMPHHSRNSETVAVIKGFVDSVTYRQS